MAPSASKTAAPRARRDQVEWRKEELLAAARRVFAQRGIDAASLKEVAAEAGVAPGLIHHYFGRKESLVMAVIERYGFLHDLESALARAEGRTAHDVLTMIATQFSRLLAEESELMTIFFTGLANAQVREALDEHMAAGHAVLGAFLDTRVKAGELRKHDTRAAAQLFLSGISIGQLTAGGTKPAVLVDLLMAGLEAPDKPSRR